MPTPRRLLQSATLLVLWATALPTSGQELHCIRSCGAERYVVASGPWIVQGGATPGEALEFCEPCKPCQSVVMLTYYGTEPWQASNGDASGGGFGPGFVTMRISTPCDGTELGYVQGDGPPGESVLVQLYCLCQS